MIVIFRKNGEVPIYQKQSCYYEQYNFNIATAELRKMMVGKAFFEVDASGDYSIYPDSKRIIMDKATDFEQDYFSYDGKGEAISPKARFDNIIDIIGQGLSNFKSIDSSRTK